MTCVNRLSPLVFGFRGPRFDSNERDGGVGRGGKSEAMGATMRLAGARRVGFYAQFYSRLRPESRRWRLIVGLKALIPSLQLPLYKANGSERSLKQQNAE